ncbi:hypothetical protein ASG42_11605 [Rhizobium sp. Leaf391]|uniref:hypothetical protein n=1 Tax=Rhizobium sp. Leaf391 TaxID=1736360 RepID=UPI0007150E4E|nr:hypothetical protein [Rhizobium sp. Leaf391]KQS91123.1 hypothetical protein ASG42_11605 [Rhizobium sp. Leaf391]
MNTGGGLHFNEGDRILRLQDGEPMKVIVYFRRAGEAILEEQPSHGFVTHWVEDEKEMPTASFSQVEATASMDIDAELTLQFHSVNAWLKENRAIVIADFTEIESGGKSRPAYGAAHKAASKAGAELVIATTKSIAGQRFSPTIQDLVNIICLEDAETIDQRRWSRSDEIVAYDWPETITLDAPPFAIALFFGSQWVRGKIPLYVANATGSRLLDVTVSSLGSTVFDGKHVGTTPSVKKLGTIETGKGRLLEAYDLQFDSDFLTSYSVTAATDDGPQYSGVAHIKEPPPTKWTRIGLCRLTGKSDDASVDGTTPLVNGSKHLKFHAISGTRY